MASSSSSTTTSIGDGVTYQNDGVATTIKSNSTTTMTNVPGNVLLQHNKHKNNNDIEQIPFLCRYWCYISNFLIPKYIPFHVKIYHIDVTLTMVSAIILGMIRYMAEYIMISLFHWPFNAYITKNSAASVTAIIHSIQLVPSLFVCFQSLPRLSTSTSSKCIITHGSNTYNPSQHITVVSNSWWKDTVDALLQFCTGYMIYDGLLTCLYMKITMVGHITTEDSLFLGHHIATILYMSSVRYIQQGHQSAMICMLLGEMTNPFHNMYYIASAAQTLSCCNGILSTFLFHYITLAFAISYVFVRTVLAPFFCLHLTYNLWTTGRRKDAYPIPIALLLLWTILIWGVILGSIPWIVECYQMIERYMMDPTPLFHATTTIVPPTIPMDVVQPHDLLTTISNGRSFDVQTEL